MRRNQRHSNGRENDVTGGGGGGGRGKQHEYNISELEMSIDRLRHNRDWSAVSALIKRYAHVFDIGSASEGGTSFTGERSRAYYWVVMAEVLIYQNQDMQNAAFCITRSAERDPDFGFWRIILVKILLMRTKNLCAIQTNLGSTKKSASVDSESELNPPKEKEKEEKLLGSNPNSSRGIQTNSYDKAIKELDEQEKNLILSSLNSFKINHSKAILSAFSALPSDEILRIFMEMLVRFNQLKVDHQDIQARKQWIYTICKKVLQNIHITDYYQQYLDKKLSEYHFWMVLDAINTRSLLREICGDLQQARSDIQQLIHVVVKQHEVALSTLPEAIRTSLLFSCCRLPILERNMNIPSASLDSFRFCVSGDSLIAPHLAAAVKIALSMTAADMMIQLAYSVYQNQQESIVDNMKSDKSQKVNNATSSKNDSIEDIINHAYMLLVHTKEMLVVTTSSTSHSAATHATSGGGYFEGPDTDMMTHHPSSLIHDLKSRLGTDYSHICRSDPINVFESSPTKAIATEHVGILLASITQFLKGKKSNIEDPLDVLTWALSVSAKPSYDLLWNLSQLYLSPNINKLNESVSLMQQCIARKATTISPEEVRAIFDRSELSTWLGLGLQIHKYSALPALKCGYTCLYGLGDPKKAVTVALQGLQQCTGEGGRECAALVQKKMNSVNAKSTTPLRQSFLTLSLMSSLGSTAVNIFQFILLMAKSFAALGRCVHAGHLQVQQWTHQSWLMFDLLESTELRDLFDHLPVSDQDDWSFEDLFYEKCRNQALASSVFDYCCLLAERGDITPAIKRLHFFLGEMKSDSTRCDISRHLHLLVVLLHTNGDAKNQGAAISQCKKAIQCTSTLQSLCSANIQLTLAHLYQRQGNLDECMALVDQQCQFLQSKDTLPPESLTLYISSMSFPFQQELHKVSLLLECSLLYRISNSLDKAQHCLEEAWRILYSPTLIGNICSVSGTKCLKDQKPAHVSADSLSEPPVNQPYIEEAQWVAKSRDVPTLPGWRLPSGMGWGIAETFAVGCIGKSREDLEGIGITKINYASFEADLLAECANIVYCRMQRTDDNGSRSCINILHVQDILTLALCIEPNHLQSNILMAKLKLDVIEGKKSHDRQLVDVLQANDYAQAALRVNRKSADAWFIVGRCYELMDLVDESVEAFLSSIEFQHLSFLRPMKHVMY